MNGILANFEEIYFLGSLRPLNRIRLIVKKNFRAMFCLLAVLIYICL